MLTHTAGAGAGARARVQALLALTLAAALAACSTDPVSPGAGTAPNPGSTGPLTAADVPGRYVLATIDGHPLPERQKWNSAEALMYDTLVLYTGGVAVETEGRSDLNSPGVLARRDVSAETWDFSALVGRLYFQYARGGAHWDYAVGERAATLTSTPGTQERVRVFTRIP